MFCIDCKKELKVRGRLKKIQKRCMACYQRTRNKSYCLDCGIKLLHSTTKRCANCFPKFNSGKNNVTWKGGLPQCKLCFNKLSVYKNSKQYGTGICQKCYRGEITKRWNKEISNDLRLNGRTINPKYTNWRKAIFTKDNYTCQICGDSKGGNLVAHHLNSFSKFPQERIKINNGITLCKNCHITLHKTIGFKENTKSQYFEYLNLVLT